MKKIFLVFLLGFILSQGAEYVSGAIIDIEQKHCYPLWTEGKRDAYQSCMDNEKFLNAAQSIIGFNFIYAARQLIWGY